VRQRVTIVRRPLAAASRRVATHGPAFRRAGLALLARVAAQNSRVVGQRCSSLPDSLPVTVPPLPLEPDRILALPWKCPDGDLDRPVQPIELQTGGLELTGELVQRVRIRTHHRHRSHLPTVAGNGLILLTGAGRRPLTRVGVTTRSAHGHPTFHGVAVSSPVHCVPPESVTVSVRTWARPNVGW